MKGMKHGNATKGVGKLGGGKKSGGSTKKTGNATTGTSKLGTSGHQNTNAYVS